MPGRPRQVPAQLQDQRQGGQRTCGDGIKGGAWLERFDAGFGHADIAQLELTHRFAQKARFLAVALHQGDVQAGGGNRQRNAGQAGAGAQIGQAVQRAHKRLHRQRIQHMLDQHLVRVADRGEVVGGIPARQQRQIVQQRRGKCGRQPQLGQAGL